MGNIWEPLLGVIVQPSPRDLPSPEPSSPSASVDFLPVATQVIFHKQEMVGWESFHQGFVTVTPSLCAHSC